MFIYINSGINQHFPLFSTDGSGNAFGKQRETPGQGSCCWTLLYVESEIIPLLAQICAWTLKNFSQLPHPSCTLAEELYFDTATSRYIMKKSSEGLKNIHSVHQTISLFFFNAFKSAVLGLHLKWETGSSTVRTLCCHIMHGAVRHSSLKSLSIHHLFPSRNFFFIMFFFLLSGLSLTVIYLFG